MDREREVEERIKKQRAIWKTEGTHGYATKREKWIIGSIVGTILALCIASGIANASNDTVGTFSTTLGGGRTVVIPTTNGKPICNTLGGGWKK